MEDSCKSVGQGEHTAMLGILCKENIDVLFLHGRVLIRPDDLTRKL